MTAASPSLFEAAKDELLAFAADLVRIPTENHPPTGDEGAGQEWLARQCREAGLSTELYELDSVPGFREHPDLWPRIFAGRKNLIARWKGSGGGRSLLFSGHMDKDEWVDAEDLVKLSALFGRAISTWCG